MTVEIFLSEAAAGVAAQLVNTTGHRLITVAKSNKSKPTKEALEIVQWFDTYKVSNKALQLEEIPDGATEEDFRALLDDDGLQSCLHSLLAARITDAPEADVTKISNLFCLTVDGIQNGLFRGISTELFDYFDQEICLLVGRLEGASPVVLDRIRSESFSARMVAALGAIERQLSSLSAPSDPVKEAEFIARYRNHVADHHGKLEPPDFKRRRRVSLDELYVSPEITPLNEPESEGNGLSLAQFSGNIDRTVLLGDPGGGKTTASTAILYRAAKDSSAPVPFLVTLREFAADGSHQRSVLEYIESRLKNFYQCQPLPGVVEKLLLSGAALVVFDGLDELIDTSRRAEITSIVEQFATEYPHVRILVTSRVVGYEEAKLDDRQFTGFRIAGFDEKRTERYVNKWFAAEDEIGTDERTLLAASFMEESSSVPDLRSNPLMLALMCILYRGERSIPQNRAEVYEQCANLLFTKWDARRKIHVDLKARRHIDPALRHLAFWLFSRNEPQSAVTEFELISETTAFLYGRGFEYEEDARSAAEEFVSFCKGRAWVFSDAGTTARGVAQYTFTHRTFLEYFAAAHLAASNDTPEKLAHCILPRIAKREWDVVCQLAVQIKDRWSDQAADRIFQSLLGNRSYRSAESRNNILRFLCDSLESTDPKPGTVRTLSHEVVENSFNADSGEALQNLITNGSAYRSTICEVLEQSIEKMEMDAQSSVRIRGLKLIIWLNSADIRRARSSITPATGFWKDASDRLKGTYAQMFRSEADNDPAILFQALYSGFISVGDYLRDKEDKKASLSVLYRDFPILWNVSWAPFMMGLLHEVMYPDAAEFQEHSLSSLDSLGRYFLDFSTPPWIAFSKRSPQLYINESSKGRVQLSEEAYLGAAISFTAFVERNGSALKKFAQSDLGALSALQPFMRCRASALSGPDLELAEHERNLTALPIPAQFVELFQEWARCEVDWTFPPA